MIKKKSLTTLSHLFAVCKQFLVSIKDWPREATMIMTESIQANPNRTTIIRVRCTTNRSIPCKKAEFEHLYFFFRTMLGFFSASEWQDLSLIFQKSEKTTYVDNLVYSRRVVVSYKRKYVHKLLVNRLLKPAQEKVWLSELTVPQ